MKPHVIHLGKGEWACGIKLSRPIRGRTALRPRGAAFGKSPSEALRKYIESKS